MTALSMVKELFGASGYRLYAHALRRHPTRFHASISQPETTTAHLVELSCRLLCEARRAGFDPARLLVQSSTFASGRPSDSLCHELTDALGPEAVSILARQLAMSRKAILHALSKPGARYHPHVRLIVSVIANLRAKGLLPHVFDIDQNDAAA